MVPFGGIMLEVMKEPTDTDNILHPQNSCWLLKLLNAPVS